MEYKFGKYCNLERWSSYWYQINEIINSGAKTVLEFGCGDGVVARYIKNKTDIQYFCADNDPELNPDYILNIANFSFENRKFDAVCAFEVLEHLPYEQFKTCLVNLKAVSNKYVLISLPHWGRHFSLSFQIPFFNKKRLQYKISTGKKHVYSGEHYWEIGKDGYQLKRVMDDIASIGLVIERHYVCHESPYHHFFVLKIKD
jgi:SAM-dependent methyltransferase